ncbi:hypothetical protein Slala02_64270 [Streptomyces lavendulae subsp. lavendulae]|nr:hypothetical protein Slala01_67880 [Streptomyces lavendulae subsp. lavendulae]GLX30607.1 hypothetical protein Slala02_64270 [Streptomyces lavendulae subsp. lavendulae]
MYPQPGWGSYEPPGGWSRTSANTCRRPRVLPVAYALFTPDTKFDSVENVGFMVMHIGGKLYERRLPLAGAG